MKCVNNRKKIKFQWLTKYKLTSNMYVSPIRILVACSPNSDSGMKIAPVMRLCHVLALEHTAVR
jgi:hypothetical protein